MNQVILCGRLTKEPDIRYSQGEKPTAVAKFTLAVDRKIKREGEATADFINCIAFGKTAEVIERYVSKGTKMIVIGEWRTGSYTNKDGTKVYTNECFVSSIEFCESRNLNPAKTTSNNGFPPMPNSSDGFMNIPDNVDDSGLPF